MSIRRAFVLSLSLLVPGPLAGQQPAAEPAPSAAAEAPAPQAGEEPPNAEFGEVVRATAVTVTVDVRDAQGKVPADLKPADLTVFEDGVEMPVLDVEQIATRITLPPAPAEPAGAPESQAETGAPEFVTPPQLASDEDLWQVVVYIDSPTVSSQTVQQAAAELAGRAEELAGFGSVEIVYADPSPQRLLPDSRDPELIARKFLELSEKGIGHNEIARSRKEFIAATEGDNLDELTRRRTEAPIPGQRGSGAGPGAGGVLDRTGRANSDSAYPSGASDFQRLNLIRSAARREFQLLARQRSLLVDWLALVERPRRPHALILVSDGFDTDPSEFYLGYLRSASQASSAQSELNDFRSSEAYERTVDTIAAAGWQVFPIALSQPGAQGAATAEQSGRGRFRGFTRNPGAQASGSGLSPFLMRAPLEPLKTIADATGGELALTPEQVGTTVIGLGERFRLTYQVPRAPDGATHALEIRSRRPGLEVRVQKAVSTASPDAMMAARARHVLGAGEAEAGDLSVVVTGSVEKDATAPADAMLLMLGYEANLGPIAAGREALDAAGLRVTMAVELPDGRILVSQERPKARDLSSDNRFVARVPLRLPKGTKRVAVAIDDVESGSWGAAVWSAGG